jgi:hypothetical protein
VDVVASEPNHRACPENTELLKATLYPRTSATNCIFFDYAESARVLGTHLLWPAGNVGGSVCKWVLDWSLTNTGRTVVGLGPRLGALVHDVNAVSSAVGDAEAKPEGHHDDRHNPQEVERESDQAKEQGDAQNARHHGVWALLLVK